MMVQMPERVYVCVSPHTCMSVNGACFIHSPYTYLHLNDDFMRASHRHEPTSRNVSRLCMQAWRKSRTPMHFKRFKMHFDKYNRLPWHSESVCDAICENTRRVLGELNN